MISRARRLTCVNQLYMTGQFLHSYYNSQLYSKTMLYSGKGLEPCAMSVCERHIRMIIRHMLERLVLPFLWPGSAWQKVHILLDEAHNFSRRLGRVTRIYVHGPQYRL